MEGPAAPCWESSVSSVWSTALSFLVVSWTWELKIAQALCLPYLKHACLKAHFSWNFLSGQTINQVWMWKKAIFKQIDLKKVTDSTRFLLSFWAQRGTERGQCDIWRSLSEWHCGKKPSWDLEIFPPSEWQAGEQLEESTYFELCNFIQA